MTATDIMFLGLVAAALGAMALATRGMRTAPGTFLLAWFASLAVCALLVRNGLGRDSGPWMAMMGTAFALCIATLVWPMIAMDLKRGRDAYGARGTDRRAIDEACAIHDQADLEIASFAAARAGMRLVHRVLDAFTTSDSEQRHESAQGRRADAAAHLARIAPDWHARRTDELIAADREASLHIAAMCSQLEPLDAAEREARRIHGLSLAAIAALRSAIDSLGSAQTYETLDAFSSNKGISVMSSIQNSNASAEVSAANAAIARLSEAARHAPAADLRVPSDTMDLVLDMALDSSFDFMSLYNLSRLSDAKSGCEEALRRVAGLEAVLHGAMDRAIANARPLRERIAGRRRRYHDAALAELPATARAHVPAAA